MTTKNDNGKLEIDLLYGSTKRPIRLTFEGKRKYRAVRRDSISDEPCEYAWKDTPDEALAELAQYIAEPLVVSPAGGKKPVADEEQGAAPFNLYQVVEDKVALLRGEGISAELIKQIKE